MQYTGISNPELVENVISRTPSKFLIGATGALKFKYQKDTVRFADGVDAQEAEEILRLIRETGWLTASEG